MNVVGKVGSLITQGVYSVATPFHPFGGAVDVIVVQQQDGTFRSTPWYVRFGKFQGVLKGAEKIVRISVNRVEANFHMYLDNSGEAYFVKEVDDEKVESNEAALHSNDKNNDFLANVHRLDHSISDTRMLQLKNEGGSSDVTPIQRAESEGDRRFYEYSEDQSSFADSVELSEYESNSYENLEGENFVDSQGPHPEMVLVVDGHVLKAPISESEQNEENVQLKNPQFHLGPGEEADIVEGNEEFISGENAWAADYISQLDDPTADVSTRVDTNGNDNNTSGIPPKVCQVEEQHISQVQETSVSKHEEDLQIEIDSKEVAPVIEEENVFQSCLEPQVFAQQDGDAGLQDVDSSSAIQNSAEESNACCLADNDIEQESITQSQNNEEPHTPNVSSSTNGLGSPKSVLRLQEDEKNASGEVEIVSGSSFTIDTERNGDHVSKSLSNDGVDESQQNHVLEDTTSDKSEVVEPQIETSDKGDQSHPGLGFEISLCGHELKVGMGLEAAAEVFGAHQISAEDFTSSAPSIIKNQNLIIKFKERYLTWEKAAPIVLGMAAYGLELPVEPKDTIHVEQDYALKSKDDAAGSSSGRRWRLWPIPFRKVKTLEHSASNASNEDIFLDSESTLAEPITSPGPEGSSHKQFVRTNVPTNEQIASLNLKDGQNLVTFSFSTRVLGTQQVDAHIYLWKWNARIVISDVDGTITKSDVLGQFMPLVGRDWTQSGVARLFSAIKENGYQLLFLSARAIVQAYLTRNFLLNLKQDGKTLPNGPVVISPDGLFPSLFREVIRRAPHEFKIACLEDIKRLFPSDYNPFYAGFGNRDTDEISYLKIGIPKGKIFIINPKGEVAISHRISTKSYTSLHTLVNDMFPPTSLIEQEDYNSWNFWKMPLPDID